MPPENLATDPLRPCDPVRSAACRTARWLTAAHVWTIFGLALSSALLGLALISTAIVRWPAGLWEELRTLWRDARAILAPLLAYAAFFGVSAWSSTVSGSMADFGSSVFTLLALPLFLLFLRGEAAVRWMLRGVLVAIAVFALYGLAQFLFTDAGPVWKRIPGPFSHYMTFSGVLLIGVVILLPRLVLAVRTRWTDWALLGLLVLTMALTLTRHVWIATLAASTLVIWIAARKWTPAYVTALLVAALAVSACAPDQWGRVRSIVDLEDPSNYDRLCMAWSGAKMIGDRPFFGLGPGAVEEVYPIYRHPSAPRADTKHLHNTFLQMAAERGLFELGAFVWLMWAAGRAGFRGFVRARERGDTDVDLYFTAFLAVVVLNLAGLFEANWRDTEVCRLMLFLMAIPWCLRTGSSSPEGSRGLETACFEDRW